MEQPQVSPPSAFAPPCPACREPGGQPRSVEARFKERVVTFVCPKCDHQWVMTTEAPNTLLFGESAG